MAVVLTGNDLTIEQVYRVAHGLEKVELHPDALQRIVKCRSFIEEKIVEGEIMYGVNTGIVAIITAVTVGDEYFRP
jgi:histidine ammonia-lyase